MVTPLAGVWIEISLLAHFLYSRMSLPLRECGLKFIKWVKRYVLVQSLPLRECGLKSVINSVNDLKALSLPLRECGLKYCFHLLCLPCKHVTPLAGVWIEIGMIRDIVEDFMGHSPCGSVD